jgi:hypothetical protein
MNWAINKATGIADSAVLYALKNKDIARTAYKSLLVMLPIQAPLIQVICIFYNSILSPESKAQIEEFIQTDEILKQFYLKYQIFLVLCKQETADPVAFFRDHKDTLGMILTGMGVRIDLTTIDMDKLKVEINTHIKDAIDMIQKYKSEIESILERVKTLIPHGGTRKNKRCRYGRNGTSRKRRSKRVKSRFNAL